MKHIKNRFIEIACVVCIIVMMLLVILCSGCRPRSIDCPEGFRPNTGQDACVDIEGGNDAANVPNVIVCIEYQDGSPVNLWQLPPLNADPLVPPFQIIGDAIRDVLDIETGLTTPTVVRDALELDWPSQMPGNCRLVIDGAQYVDGHICTPCTGCVVDSGELLDVRDEQGNMIPNTITIGNNPDGHCGIGHVPDCSMWVLALWRPYLSLSECCEFAGTAEQDVCSCPVEPICDEGVGCECLYIPTEDPI